VVYGAVIAVTLPAVYQSVLLITKEPAWTESIETTMNDEIYIGTRDWDVDAWVGDYYPQELPDDWRFCFHTNNVRALMVPATIWADTTIDNVEAWLEDCDDAFRFFLELPPAMVNAQSDEAMAAAWQAWQQLIAPIATRVAALVLGDRKQFATVEQFARVAKCIAGSFPLAVYPGTVNVERNDTSIGSVWYPAEGGRPEQPGACLLAVVDAGGAVDPRTLRDIVEALAAYAGGERLAALFFDGLKAPQQVQQARIVAELLGV